MPKKVSNPKSVLDSLESVEGMGYKVTDIKDRLGPSLFEDFSKWFTGQTGAISRNGDLLVYHHDLERFLNGLDDLEWAGVGIFPIP